MTSRLRALAAALALLVAAALTGLLFHFNRGDATLSLGPLGSLAGPLAALVLGAFACGMATIWLTSAARRLTRGALALRGQRRRRLRDGAQRLRDEGIERLWSGQTTAAARLLERAVERRPDDLEAVLALVDALAGLGDTARAQRVLDDTRTTLGPLPRLLARIGDLHAAQGNTGAAIEDYREALHRLPASPHLLERTATLLAAGGRAEDAIELARRRLAAEPQGPRRESAREQWLALRYRALQSAPDGPETRAALARIVNEFPGFTPAVLALVDHMIRSGDPRGAERILDQAARRSPNGAILERLREMAVTSPEAAIRRLRGIASRSGGGVSKLVLARALAAAGQVAEAATELAGVERSNQLAPEHDLVAGEIALARGDAAAAAHEFQRAADGSHRAFAHRCAGCGRSETSWRADCEGGRCDSYDWVAAPGGNAGAPASK